MSALSADGSTSEVASSRSSLLYSPLIQGPSLSQELMETKGKLRMLQDQVYVTIYKLYACCSHNVTQMEAPVITVVEEIQTTM